MNAEPQAAIREAICRTFPDIVSTPFQQKQHKLGKRYREKRMIGNLRMPGKAVKVRILDWPMMEIIDACANHGQHAVDLRKGA